MATESNFQVEVVFSSTACQVKQVAVSLPSGANVEQAITKSEILSGLPVALVSRLEVGVWGRKVSLSHPLQTGDRVEIYRPLTVDPKVARRERFNRQGTRGAGLFLKRRPGAKPGY